MSGFAVAGVVAASVVGAGAITVALFRGARNIRNTIREQETAAYPMNYYYQPSYDNYAHPYYGYRR